MKCLVKRPVVASATVLAAASLAVGGCGSSGSSGNSSTAGCFSKGVQSAASGAAADWTLPGASLQNTRAVASPITSSNVAKLGVAWCVPIESTGSAHAAGLADGYATTGAVLLKTPLSAGTNAPVTIAGDYVIAGAAVPLSQSEQELIIAYKVGATGKLPDTVG